MKWIVLIFVISLFVSCQNKVDNKEKELSIPNKEEKLPDKKPEVKEVIVLPKYEVLDRVRMVSGITFADILIPAFTPTMSKDSLSKIAFAILKKERLDEAEFYSTKDAYKSMYSSSFSDKNPNASKKGYLGGIKNYVFRPQ